MNDTLEAGALTELGHTQRERCAKDAVHSGPIALGALAQAP
jgi:hypothetical protein